MRRVSLLSIASLLFCLFLTACGPGAPAATPTPSSVVIEFTSVGIGGPQDYRVTAPAGFSNMQSLGSYSAVTSADGTTILSVAEVNPQEAFFTAATEGATYTVNNREVRIFTAGQRNVAFMVVEIDGNLYNMGVQSPDMSDANLERLANIVGTLEVINE
jgi:hypothetical protein